MSEKRMPLISVIVPMYGVEKYIRRCIDSLLAQDYPNLEIIAVNDGSPDRSAEIVSSIHDARLHLLNKKNGGLSDARNAGAAIAAGEYIAYVDGDDYVEPGMYSALYAALEKAGTKIALCGFNKVTDEGVLRRRTAMNFPDVLSEDDYWYKLFFPFRDLGTVVWNKLYHRSLIPALHFPVGKIHEDEWVVHHYVPAAGSLAVVKECLYNYVVREGSITAQALSPKSLAIFGALRERLVYFAGAKKDRAVVLTMRNYAHYVTRFQSDWKKDEKNAALLPSLRADFRAEIQKYKSFASLKERVYWFAALHFPMAVRKVIDRRKARRKKQPQAPLT